MESVRAFKLGRLQLHTLQSQLILIEGPSLDSPRLRLGARNTSLTYCIARPISKARHDPKTFLGVTGCAAKHAARPSARDLKSATAATVLPSLDGQVKVPAVSLESVGTININEEKANAVQKPTSQVYIILVPLDLPNGLLAAAVDFTRVAFKQRMEHAMVLVEEPDGKCVCFDFRPVDPENPAVCFTLLTGRTSPGILRQSSLSRLPKKNCWLVGESKRSITEAIDFHKNWDSSLHLIRNNCYTHTDALVEHLTGQPKILETLNLGAQKRLVEVFPMETRKRG